VATSGGSPLNLDYRGAAYPRLVRIERAGRA